MATGITYITTQGAILAAKTMESKILRFSKFKVGDGTLPNDDVDTIKALNDLVHPLLNFNVTNIVRDNEIRIDVQGVFQNTDADSAFWLRELGLYAIDPDTEEEVLFAYINYGDKAEYMNNSISEKQERFYDMFIVVDNADNVSIMIDPTVSYVSLRTFNQTVAGLHEEIRQAAATAYRPKGSVQTYNDLPTEDNEIGDVYNIIQATTGKCKAGDNVVWVGTDQSEDGWDLLAGTVDLSAYILKSEVEENYVKKEKVAPKNFTLNTANFTQEGDLYKCVITDAGITASSSVWVDISKDSMPVAEDAGVKSYITTADGTATVYADSIPSANITGTYIIVGGV